MRYDKWKTIKSVTSQFNKSLEVLTDLFGKIANSSGSNTETYRAKMRKFQESEAFNNYILSAVKRMVTPLAVKNMSTWREAAKKATKSKMLYNLLLKEIQQGLDQDIETQIQHNITLIKTLPLDVADKVVHDIEEQALKGRRAEEIAGMIRSKTDQHARASARLISRTEVSKTTTALTRARSENLELNWYVWRTAQDGNRVRPSHRIMEGVLVNWKDPPAPEELVGEKSVGHYHAGEIWNCRCYPEPLLEVADVRWPCKVYRNGSIKSMRKTEFEQII